MKQVCYFERLLNAELFEQLITQDGDIALSRIDRDMPDSEIDAALSKVHGYHTRGNQSLIPKRYIIDSKFLEKCPNLVAVSTGGAGYDSIIVEDCTNAGILVTNQAGLNAEAVAEHAIGMMLCLTKQIAQVNMAMRRDPDLDRFAFRNNDMYGKTLGIVGLGQIGALAAHMCKTAFGMNVIATHPRITPEQAAERNARLVDFPEILEQSDFVLVSCGLNDETRGMFGDNEFARMKPSAYFITIGRGGIHDEDALARALSAGEVAGAGLDVWMQEPPPHDHPLLGFENVLASPHIAALTHESAQKAMTGAAAQWRQILNGEFPPRCVNPTVWPQYAKRFEAIMGRPAASGQT
ncbi:MAG: hydroxyacid dehydrogenase [Rhodospirillaceae bacterium]|jgi:D-3-phosphoglycerate dehydrogenase / 2-oxoglutarate reductase|nr:hydroxyacid dehydrogenase [Rhodospirillaceae bacterium]MBT5665990.1 hydroxyacid dehydrogenase [Rhodospirillaceae bacterium]